MRKLHFHIQPFTTMFRIAVALLVLGGAVLCSNRTLAQEYPCSDANAAPLDSIHVTHVTNPSGTPLEQKLKSTQSTWEIVIMMTGGGTPSLFIPVESVQFSGSGVDSVNSVSTNELFLLIDYVSVQRALDSSLIPTPSPGNSYNLNLYHSGCIGRGGSGSETYFVSGMSGCCRKTYTIARPGGGGSPTIALVGSNGPTCSVLDSTCDEESLLFSLMQAH